MTRPTIESVTAELAQYRETVAMRRGPGGMSPGELEIANAHALQTAATLALADQVRQLVDIIDDITRGDGYVRAMHLTQ